MERIHSGSVYNVALWIEQDGKLLARNEYHDVFYMPQHTPGHPTYMSHETRLQNLLGIELRIAGSNPQAS